MDADEGKTEGDAQMKVKVQAESLFIGTANKGFAQRAQEEIRRLMPGSRFSYLVPHEIFLMTLPLSTEQAIECIKQNEPIFLRHIQPVDVQLHITKNDNELKLIRDYFAHCASLKRGDRVAIQIRRIAPDDSYTYTASEMRQSIGQLLSETHDVAIVTRQADQIISIVVTDEVMYCGMSRPDDNLSDWAGGAIRFKKEANHISRAKFKLLEAEQAFGLDFTKYHKALDIGAAPGGWTSLLLERGLSVTAVDPGAMHPSLLKHPQLTFLRKNANDVTFEPHSFDLLVCDMSWSPRQMSKLIANLCPALRAGSVAIITAKLLHKNAFQTVRDISSALEPYMQLIRAKHLFHNRAEMTLYFIKK